MLWLSDAVKNHSIQLMSFFDLPPVKQISIFISMKWIVCIFLAGCLQSVISRPPIKSVSFEDNSLYFRKGEYQHFFNDQLERFRELQLENPSIVFEFSLFQLESEPRSLALKRHKVIVKRFQEARLDMSRILFDSKTVYVKDFKNHALSFPSLGIDSVGAVLEGRNILID